MGCDDGLHAEWGCDFFSNENQRR